MTNRGRVVAAFVVVSASVATWLMLGGEATPKASSQNATPAKEQGGAATATLSTSRSEVTVPRPFVSSERPAVQPPPQPESRDDSERSPLADKLNAPTQTGRQDVAVVLNLCAEYRKRFHGFPVGEDNASFVNALSGRNPARLAFLPRDHSAIDAQGQLLDRWGKPYFFHLLSRDALEIRSSGPDREIYTPDDVVIQSPQAREPSQ